MANRFIFDQEGDEQNDNDDVVGCVVGSDEKRCYCISCGKENCIYPGSMRGEVA